MADEAEARMSKPKFTPGPWKWDEHGDLRGKMRNAVINPNLRGDVLSGINREADAHLIAAAPELYEACADALYDIKRERPQWSGHIYRMQAALAKARGES